MERPTLWGEAVDQVPINNLIPTLNEQLFLCQPLVPSAHRTADITYGSVLGLGLEIELVFRCLQVRATRMPTKIPMTRFCSRTWIAVMAEAV